MQKGFTPILIILLLVVGVGGYLLYNRLGYSLPKEAYNNYSNNLVKPIQTPQLTISPSPTNYNKECSLKTNKISISLPSGWKCDDATEENQGFHLKFSSDLFTVTFSNYGIGAPQCKSNSTCPIFYKDNKITLTRYDDGLLFGGFKDFLKRGESFVYIGVVYKDMDKRAVTESEKKDLVDILNLIKY